MTAPTPPTPLPPEATPATPTSLPAAVAVCPRQERRYAALTNVGAHVRFWSVMVAGLALDLWSKHWAFYTLGQDDVRVIIPKVLEFRTTLNPGALFGIGAGHTHVFLIASVLALGLVLWMFAQSAPKRWSLQIALGAILAGALGNMYDRMTVQVLLHGYPTQQGVIGRYYEKSVNDHQIVLHEYPAGRPGGDVQHLPLSAEARLRPVDGHVRDFIKIPTHWRGDKELWPWVFNVADMLLVGGVILLAVRLMFERPPRSQSEPPTATGEANASPGP